MALPTYDKSNRRRSYQQLPKAAYVVRIIGAKEVPWKNGSGTNIEIGFDIAEGDYAGFYQQQYDGMDPDKKKWPNDGIFRLQVPTPDCEEYIRQNYNTFFADLEDSNGGFVFDGDVKKLKGKLIGAKMHIEQSEYRGSIYEHTRMRWTCVADDVRNGKAGKLPNDKLVDTRRTSAPQVDSTGFMAIPDGADDEVPF